MKAEGRRQNTEGGSRKAESGQRRTGGGLAGSLAAIRAVALLCVIAFSLAASEHHGMVQFGGLPVPGAAVTATMGEKKISAITDSQGLYSFPDLADGVWTLRVEMLCFEPQEKQIGVAPSAPGAQFDLKLLSADQIMASAAPPASSPAPPPAASQPAGPAPAAAATPSIVAAQPPSAPAKPANKKSNSKTSASTPAPSTTKFQRTDVNASAATEASSAPAPSNGGLSDGNASQAPSDGFLINGSVNNGASSPFAQSAAFGNNRKGPRSLYSGNLGLQTDNSIWDARTYSQTGQDTPKPPRSIVQGMATFGGPLKIPHLIERNGPNITITYQWSRNRTANTQSVLFPTALQRTGDFTQTVNALGQALTVYDPTTNKPFPGDAIPALRISKQASLLMPLYPNPSFSGSTLYNYQSALTNGTHGDQIVGRVSKSIKRKDQLSGQFSYSNSRSDSPSILGFLDTAHGAGMNGMLNWTHRFTMRLFLSVAYTYSRNASRMDPFFAFRQNIAGNAGITGDDQTPNNWGPPTLQFSNGIGSLSDAQSSYTRNQTNGVTPNLTWSHGSHNITAVGNFLRQQFNYLSQTDPRGTFTFTGAATQGLLNGTAIPATGYDFADFLLGLPDVSSISFGNADKYLRATPLTPASRTIGASAHRSPERGDAMGILVAHQRRNTGDW